MWRAVLLWFCLPGLAAAQDALNAQDFDALTLGKTYYYNSGGQPYGAEEYLPNRKVRWSFLDGQCMDGHWWQEGEFICFAYDERPDDHHCWTFRMKPGGLAARFENDPNGRELYEVEQTDKPMMCLGPKIGV